MRDLQLEVFINGTSTGMVGAFKQLSDGSLAVAPDEARAVGLKPAREAIGSDGLVHLDLLQDVHYRLDEPGQRLYVDATDGARAPRIIDVNPAPTVRAPRSSPGFGGVLNYTLFASSDRSSVQNYTNFNGVSGSGAFEARAFTPYGTLNQSFLANSAVKDLGVVRLDTTWTYSDPETLITYRAGDMISGGLSWTRPVRLGGLQAQRSFALRPDLVTMPIPSLSGTAAVPSTFDVYTQNVKTYSGSVPAGPFEITNMPIATGAGAAQVVLHDALGRESVTTMPFYTSNLMLRGGLYDFSVETGVARRSDGVESNNYDRHPMGSGSFRYGLNNALTLEGHAEGGHGLVNAGAGATFSLGWLGVASLAAAGSDAGRQIGGLLSASVEGGYQGFTFYIRSQRSLAAYRDIASVTVDCSSLRGSICGSGSGLYPALLGGVPATNILPPRALDQAGVGIPLPFDSSHLNFTFAQVQTALSEKSRIVGASYSRPFLADGTIYMNIFKDLGNSRNFGALAGVSFPLGGNISVSAAGQRDADGWKGLLSATKAEQQEEGSYGWQFRDQEGAKPDRYAGASYRASFGRAEATVEESGKDVRATGQLDGSIATAGGGVFFGNRIDDAFAVVNAGTPDVEVKYENRPVGKTNSQGMLLVPYLNSYQKNKISIDPKNLPVDADIASTDGTIVPADRNGVVVDFGVTKAPRAALVSFVDGAGKPLRAGLRGRLENGGDAFVVGYDGQAYIRNLSDQNAVAIEISENASCRAEFGYTPQPGKQVVIRDVVCR